jgi:iron only hydrogenase large subunit-like protein
VLTGDAADGPQAVKVSLNDCLACSGCVTSAETVLLQAQSLREFVARCGDADAHVVVSVSPQSRASLAGARGGACGAPAWRVCVSVCLAAPLHPTPLRPPRAHKHTLAHTHTHAALHGIPPEQVQDRLAAFLRSQLAVDLVLDTTLGQGLALAEAAAEFLAR